MDLAAVYSRRVDDQVLTLAPSGWTYESTFVLYDRETGSLWYPFDEGLMSIQGDFFKRWLPKIPSEDTLWKDWTKKHPNSSILK
ncbi:MAG: DUF3179 domain-containing protein [Deltaproteobacteria bacterium]|nr:DUF3179 domain-containing protein [Deltaproteobacteria bacterium]